MNEWNAHSGSAFQAIRAIDYTVIFVRDMAAMRRFYEDILGFPRFENFREAGSNIGWATTPWPWPGQASRADARRPWQCLASAGLHVPLPTSIGALTSSCGTASTCSHRRLTRSDIPRCSSGIRMAIRLNGVCGHLAVERVDLILVVHRASCSSRRHDNSPVIRRRSVGGEEGGEVGDLLASTTRRMALLRRGIRRRSRRSSMSSAEIRAPWRGRRAGAGALGTCYPRTDGVDADAERLLSCTARVLVKWARGTCSGAPLRLPALRASVPLDVDDAAARPPSRRDWPVRGASGAR